MRRIAVLAAAALMASSLAGPPASAAKPSDIAHMSGDQEVPQAAPANARGTAWVTINADAGQLCYQLAYEGTSKPAAGHIHRGGKGTAGPVAVNLDPAAHGNKACVTADPGLLNEIKANPGGFYVNLHTADYPKGVMRGQLETFA
jgi:hypothetical protein